MKKTKYILLSLLVIAFMSCLSGCQVDFKQMLQKADLQEEPQLIEVELTFTDDVMLVAYVKGLGIEEDGQVYIGGSSMNYLYDKDGNITGAFNYQRLIYMKILTEESVE
ncbi:MAG: hypothetical protein U9N81_01665 [Bacillota bacterium]|nr:hypothetical protein [Bacillota bacterium]